MTTMQHNKYYQRRQIEICDATGTGVTFFFVNLLTMLGTVVNVELLLDLPVDVELLLDLLL